MTAQFGDQLRYNGKKYKMATQPFDIYLETHNIQTVSECTANWRGYYGEWEIIKGKLFLVSISANIRNMETKRKIFYSYKNYAAVDLEYFFPGQKKVFAEWFSGKIRLPVGEMLAYIHMGYASIFEKDIILKFKDGILISEKVINNREKLVIKTDFS
ncbi:hypothetical protein M2103_002564 [Ereboglobus sp. PH5-5]|uniref:hypothetical protein n=1 Tax=Ereboglobus sp. PH5-5 TaxID=2940529 RepID=UPI0024050546|nr:hypothetical protein [Ereboglobus sp. PH5-5]MDF9834319.1 hypothetical protein [Ereboglobus sp. PH5-5]